MRVPICILILSFSLTFGFAQSPDSSGISYSIDTIASPNCYQSGDGAILLDDVTVPGTIDRYEWSNGANTEDLIYVNGGKYQLTVYNTDGESFKTEEFFIPQPDTLVIKYFISPPTSPLLDNGFIDLTIRGGTGPFKLTMTFNQDTTTVTTDSTFSLNGIDTGFYNFSVMDYLGCVDSASFSIFSTKPCEMLATALVEPAECKESPSGRIELLIENAVEPVTIDWSSGKKNQQILYNLDAGIYKFTISDRRKCIIIDSIKIIYEDRIPPEAIVKDNILLYLDKDGKASLTSAQVLIGARDKCHNDLSFDLEKSKFTCDDVGTNMIDFYVTDGVGNTATKPIKVEIRDTQAIKILYEDTVYTALCNSIAQYEPPRVQGSCSTTSTAGLIKATTREITTPGTYVDRYYFVKKPGDTLKANVTVIVADARVRAFLNVEDPLCSKGDDGSIAVKLRNFKGPVTYQWDDKSQKDFIFGLYNQREYRVTVTEGHGCVFELSASINGADSLSVELQEIIEKEKSIVIIPRITGGNRPLRYEWYEAGSFISDFQNLLNAEDGKRYQLIVKDAAGCVSQPLIVDRTMTSSSSPTLDYQIDIFPNPVSGASLFIRFNQDFESYHKVRLVNSQQQVLKEIVQLQPEVNLSLSSIPPGLYFIQFFRKEGIIFSKKFIRI